MNQKARLLSEQPDQSMLMRLRVLEQKMGLVMTLVSFRLPFCDKSMTFIFVVQGIRVGRHQ